ncbi:MAG TPA: hypothetical protein VGD69_17140 [Herpetosiphonaceae bacterium]
MFHGLGHYRKYRLAAALDRLNAYPPQSKIALSKAAHLLGVSEAQVRALVQRHGSDNALDGNQIGVATLRHVIRQARAAKGQA